MVFERENRSYEIEDMSHVSPMFVNEIVRQVKTLQSETGIDTRNKRAIAMAL